MIGLSKSKLTVHRQCPRRLWLQTYRKELAEQDKAVEYRMAAGSNVGEVARDLYPGGILIDDEELRDALSHTDQVLREHPGKPIFEATCQHDGVLVRADLLLPSAGGYRLAEVKSTASVKDCHYEDAAIQAWVIRGAGVAVSRVEIAHIDTSFVYPGEGDYQGLFIHADITARTDELAEEIPQWVAAARATLSSDEPQIACGTQCIDPFECPFKSYCSPGTDEQIEIGYPPEILPNSRALLAELRAEGYTDLRDVPAGRLGKPQFERIRRASVTGQAEIDPEVKTIMSTFPYPRYYLDFETVQFAVPIWAGTSPYRGQIPFQWSCHIESADGDLSHAEFLAEGTSDPRQRFAETLVNLLDGVGTIFVYNASFERTRLRELAEQFPHLAPALSGAIEHIVDLLPITRNYYYHPAMMGKWSIKNVLPTIAPDLAYEGMAVADGKMAQQSYKEQLHPDTTPERREELRNGLLEYCKLDTLAMVRLVEFFEKC